MTQACSREYSVCSGSTRMKPFRFRLHRLSKPTSISKRRFASSSLDASHFLKSPSPRNRSLSRSRKQRQDVHRLRRSSLGDGLFKVELKLSRILASPPKAGNGVSVRSLIQIKRDQARATNHKSSCIPQVAALRESNQSGRVF